MTRTTVDIWCITLRGDDAEVEAHRRLLSTDEQNRADRLLLPAHQRRFILAHGALRRILGEMTGELPASLSFLYGPVGKPDLEGGPPFNLSHSHDLALLAIGPGGDVGVDLERRREFHDALALASRFFCPDEVQEIGAVEEPERSRRFLRLWTRKEAWIKAIGSELHNELGHVDVRFERPRRIDGVGDEIAHCLIDLEVDADYTAALAIVADEPEIRIRDWRPRGLTG